MHHSTKLAKAMKEAFSKIGVKVTSDSINEVMGEMESQGLFGTCKEGCKDACKTGCKDGGKE